MRLIARFSDKNQAGFLVDALRNVGFDRKDLIVSNATGGENWNSPEEASDEISFIKTERDGIWEADSFAEGINGLKVKEGILVAVEAPKHDATRIRELMEQSGALEIVQD